MLILKYFHKTKRKDQEDNVEIKFPDPDGDLSKTVPSKAIYAANELIEQLLEPKLKGVRKMPYLVLTPAQRFAVGKFAVIRIRQIFPHQSYEINYSPIFSPAV